MYIMSEKEFEKMKEQLETSQFVVKTIEDKEFEKMKSQLEASQFIVKVLVNYIGKEKAETLIGKAYNEIEKEEQNG